MLLQRVWLEKSLLLHADGAHKLDKNAQQFTTENIVMFQEKLFFQLFLTAALKSKNQHVTRMRFLLQTTEQLVVLSPAKNVNQFIMEHTAQ